MMHRIPNCTLLTAAVQKLGYLSGLRPLTRVATRHPVAALTFDDGPHPDYTPRLLATLARYEVRATFFMVGEAAERYPALVRQVAQAGHTIGNHSWDHQCFLALGGRLRRRQIRQCARSLEPYGDRLFRPPYGEQSLASRFDALWLRYRAVGWSLDAEDWREQDASSIAGRVARLLEPGSIVLFHDSIHRSRQRVPQYNRDVMLTALDLLLERFQGRFQFVPVSELLRFGRPITEWRIGA
jgi:peptidoglycan/xylan/chitin deacetylase (PgdA/CDA1 family)